MFHPCDRHRRLKLQDFFLFKTLLFLSKLHEIFIYNAVFERQSTSTLVFTARLRYTIKHVQSIQSIDPLRFGILDIDLNILIDDNLLFEIFIFVDIL